MPFGIDDALLAAAAGLKLTNTLIEIAKEYREKGKDIDITQLLDEVRHATRESLRDADLALIGLERTLEELGINPNKTIEELLKEKSRVHPFQRHRLKAIRRSFNALADASYEAADDIEAL